MNWTSDRFWGRVWLITGLLISVAIIAMEIIGCSLRKD